MPNNRYMLGTRFILTKDWRGLRESIWKNLSAPRMRARASPPSWRNGNRNGQASRSGECHIRAEAPLQFGPPHVPRDGVGNHGISGLRVLCLDLLPSRVAERI